MRTIRSTSQPVFARRAAVADKLNIKDPVDINNMGDSLVCEGFGLEIGKTYQFKEYLDDTVLGRSQITYYKPTLPYSVQGASSGADPECFGEIILASEFYDQEESSESFKFGIFFLKAWSDYEWNDYTRGLHVVDSDPNAGMVLMVTDQSNSDKLSLLHSACGFSMSQFTDNDVMFMYLSGKFRENLNNGVDVYGSYIKEPVYHKLPKDGWYKFTKTTTEPCDPPSITITEDLYCGIDSPGNNFINFSELFNVKNEPQIKIGRPLTRYTQIAHSHYDNLTEFKVPTNKYSTVVLGFSNGYYTQLFDVCHIRYSSSGTLHVIIDLGSNKLKYEFGLDYYNSGFSYKTYKVTVYESVNGGNFTKVTSPSVRLINVIGINY